MKKTYEKPKLIALSLSGNNMLCNTCAVDIIGSNMNDEFRQMLEDLDININDLDQAFGENDCEGKKTTIIGYCKFNGADNRVVINS